MGMMQPVSISPDFVPQTAEDWKACMSDPLWRICSGQLYKIMVKGDDDTVGHVLPFRPNSAQKRLLRHLHNRNVILKARQLGFCLEVSTRVLTADLRWVAIADLRPGDEVVSVDENVPGGRGQARKMRAATIEAVNPVRRMGFCITFADGRSVTCTDQHPWLARSGDHRQPFWRAMDKSAPNAERALRVGHQVRSICSPWGEPTYEDGWFGGLIDGEGSIAKRCASGAEVNVAQRQGAVWDRMTRYAADRGYSARIESDDATRLSKYGHVPVPKMCFTRMDELFRLIGQTRPSRMIANRFWEGKELPGKRNADNAAWNEIVSIEPVGMVDMIDLQTSTGTFIAEGMVSHNTTLIAIIWLDHALFVPDQRCGIIAHSLDDAAVIFRDKVKFAYLNLPDPIRERFPLSRDSAKELMFGHNNSSIRVATSMRSGTIHRLHISEMGKIAAKYPEKAVEIVTGSLPAVPLTGIAVIESTAEGQDGEFYNIATKAEALAQEGRYPTPQEWMFHFFPWWQDPGYQVNPAGVRITAEQHAYFDEVQTEMECTLTMRQRAWYVQKLENDFSGDAEKMWREMPSTPEECWRKSAEGTFYAPQIARVRIDGRLCDLPHVEGVHVHTFWDIGSGDGTAIWCMQHVGGQHRFIRFIEDWGKGYSHYINALRNTGWLFGTHYLPHDANHTRQMAETIAAPLDMLTSVAPDWRWHIVPRVSDIQHGITLTRQQFSQAWFNRADDGVMKGFDHLALYHKKWNARLGVWSHEPEKMSGHSEAADAFRQWAQGFDPTLLGGQSRPRRTRKGAMAS